MTHAGQSLVAHIIHRLDYGGLENGLVNLVNRLPAERYRHAIVCLSGFSEEFRQTGTRSSACPDSARSSASASVARMSR